MPSMNCQSHAPALGAFCCCDVLIILGFQPLAVTCPQYDVAWFTEGNGLCFGDHGTVLCSSAFETHGSRHNDSGSLETWLDTARQKVRNKSIEAGPLILS